MAGHFMSQRAMNELRHQRDVALSRAKREKKQGEVLMLQCGCSPDCVFVHFRDDVPLPKLPKAKRATRGPGQGMMERTRYDGWLRTFAR